MSALDRHLNEQAKLDGYARRHPTEEERRLQDSDRSEARWRRWARGLRPSSLDGRLDPAATREKLIERCVAVVDRDGLVRIKRRPS